MPSILPFQTYRFEIVEGLIPVRIIGLDGRQNKDLSRACSLIWAEDQSTGHREAARHVSLFVWGLNVASRTIIAAADVFVSGVSGCRDVTDAIMLGLKVSSKSADRDGSRWLTPAAYLYGRVAELLNAIGKITDALVDEAFEGQDPSKVDKERSRIDGRSIRYHVDRRGEIKSDTDRRLRLGQDPSSAPRCEEPKFYEQLLAGLNATKAPLVFEFMCALAKGAGPRYCQLAVVTLHDVFVRRRERGRIAGWNKGAEANTRPLTFVPSTSLFQRLLDEWIDGPRARLTGVSLAQVEAMAKTAAGQAALKTMLLFTENGSDPVGYQRLYRAIRKAAIQQNLYIDDDRYRAGPMEGRKRYVTFHWLRHEYVHLRLDRIMALPSSKQKSAKDALIAYMGWSHGAKMLSWYSAHHVVKLSNAEALAYADDMDAAAAGARPTSHDRRAESEHDELAELLAELNA